MFEIADRASACKDLLREYENSKSVSNPQKIVFEGADGHDVYNITAPFEDDGNLVIAGRVEDRNTEISKVRFFVKFGDVWKPAYPNKVFHRFQDPFFTKVNGKLIVGGVQLDSDPLDEKKIICWRTLFFRGKNINDLKLFAVGPNRKKDLKLLAVGPNRMKDIRIVGLKDGGIGVFTRPQGGSSGMGKIGYIRLDKLEDLSEQNILKARIFDTHFVDGEWGGVNEPHLLKNGLVGVLGHIAYWENFSVRHYYAMAFVFNPETLEHSKIRIIARRSDFSDGAFKRPDLQDVLFSGGLIRLGNGRARLYTGVADAEAHMMEIEDPFEKFE